MKAIQINKYGGINELVINENVTTPLRKTGQVLVEVEAVSLNPADWKIRAGYWQKFAPLTFPVTLGGDFSGRVIEEDPDNSAFSKNDEVYGQAIVLNGSSGALAEFAVVNVKNIAKKPKNIDFVQAASLPLTGVSAIQALEDHMKLQKGNKILIHGGSGGIGSTAIQLAKTLGAFVTTTVSTNNMDFAKKLGADEVIDYKSERFENITHDFDAVFDTVGGETTDKSFYVLKKGGILVTMIGNPKEELANKLGVSIIKQNTVTDTEHLDKLTKYVENNAILPHVDKIFSLAQIKNAFEHLESGHPKGKVVVKIK